MDAIWAFLLFYVPTSSFKSIMASKILKSLSSSIKQTRLIKSYRQSPSFKKILTRAKFIYTERVHDIGVSIINDKKVTKCNDKNAVHAVW